MYVFGCVEWGDVINWSKLWCTLVRVIYCYFKIKLRIVCFNQVSGRTMLPLQHPCPDTARVCRWVQEKRGHVAIKNTTGTAWRTRKSLIICHRLSLAFRGVRLSKEEFPTHRLFPASATVGGAPVPSISLPIISSSHSIIHLKPKLQISNQIGPTEVGCVIPSTHRWRVFLRANFILISLV